MTPRYPTTSVASVWTEGPMSSWAPARGWVAKPVTPWPKPERPGWCAWTSTINGFVDIVGMARFAPLLELDDETWDWEFDICLRHAYLLSQEFGPSFAEHRKHTGMFFPRLS